jgi:protein gp37
MSLGSKIEWTDATWNPTRGCTKISPGCAHCYADWASLSSPVGAARRPGPSRSATWPTRTVCSFALEEHLESFLIANWHLTEVAKEYDIYEEDGQQAQQYPTDTGRIDIQAISKDKKRLLVVELKKGKAADVAVGQTLEETDISNEA